MQQIYQSYKGIFCEGYYVVSNEFYDANKKPAGAGSGVFGAVFEPKLWVIRQLRRVE